MPVFRLYFDQLEMNVFAARFRALRAARELSRELAREVTVEGPKTRYIYAAGELDRFWYDMRRR